MEGLRVAVIGGSIAGLSAATALHRLGAAVTVFEKSPTAFHGRGGSLGFCDVPLWEQLAGRRMLRRGAPSTRRQGAWLYGDLWKFLAEGLPAGVLRLGAAVSDLGDNAARPTVLGEAFDLAVVADGGWSALRAKYFDARHPDYAGYAIYRFRVERARVPGWDAEGSYESALGDPFFTIQMNIAKDDGSDWLMGGTSVACPEGTLPPPDAGAGRQAGDPDRATGDWFVRRFYSEHFPHAGGALHRAMAAAAAHGKISGLPLYEFAARSVVSGARVLVGDAAHMASPRTAVGAHTAVLDAAALHDAFARALREGGRDGLVARALAAYERPALRRAAELYQRSKQVSAPVAWREGLTPRAAAVAARVGGAGAATEEAGGGRA